MPIEKNRILREVENRALREARHLAGEFARAASEQREAILAGLEFEKWLAQCCSDVRAHPSPEQIDGA